MKPVVTINKLVTEMNPHQYKIFILEITAFLILFLIVGTGYLIWTREG